MFFGVDLFNLSLAFAWLLSAITVFGFISKLCCANKLLCNLGAKSVYLTGSLGVLSTIGLAILFLRDDYRYLYVWQNSNAEMHPFYKISAVWGGMNGSILLWAALGGIFAIIAVRISGRISDSFKESTVLIVSISNLFFFGVVLFLCNPFEYVSTPVAPATGHGLNPLLQNPSMLIHPPLLYLGFTGFIVPFAFAMAGLLSGELENRWVKEVRLNSLVAWMFLTAGIILGGNWAYIELGWGGFWAWDPVENASFLPWLTATAYIHSSMVQLNRGMLKGWNVILPVMTYSLTLFGTFLTRSGVVQSVHSFAKSDLGWVFLAYLILVVFLSTCLYIWRRKKLKPENSIQSFFSREVVFLFNNLILLSICFATIWGVLLPVITEAVTGTKSVVGPPYFNRVNGPLFLGLFFLLGIGPLISWKKANIANLRKVFSWNFLFGLIVIAIAMFFSPDRPVAALAFGSISFAMFTAVVELHRIFRSSKKEVNGNPNAGKKNKIKRFIAKSPAHVIHLGATVMAIAAVASTVYKTKKT